MCCNNSPCTCGGTCNNCQSTSSDTVKYIGPNLPITGINFNDNITLALQKVEAVMNGLQGAVAAVQMQLTTTTTTTIAPTTSTTTEAPTTTSTTTEEPTTTTTTTV